MKTIYVILEVIYQVRLDGAVVPSGHSTHTWKPSLSNKYCIIFKSKHNGKIPMQDREPVVDTSELRNSQNTSGAAQLQIMPR